jgi:ankyrin repeat protein
VAAERLLNLAEMSDQGLNKPFVFIGGPSDVAYLRLGALRELESLKERAADDFGIEPYLWEDDKAENGFDVWLPAQAQIPLPAGPRCKAVISIFGERIGTPLPDDFPLDAIGGEGFRDRNQGPRLIHPWRPGAEQEGGFPLSGSVFEALAAVAANGEVEDAQALERGNPPVLLLFVGDRTILDAEDPEDGNWGGGRLLERVGREKKRAEMRRWQTEVYVPQLRQLRNFLRYLEARGRLADHGIVEDEEIARARTRRFLERGLGLRAEPRDVDPFKRLEAYDVGDSQILFGRRDWRDYALREFSQLWSEEGRLPFYGVVGESGVGKSSLLRAGLIGHLVHHTSRGLFVGCVISALDLATSDVGRTTESEPDDAALAPLARAYGTALAAIDPERGDAEAQADLSKLKIEHQAQAAVKGIVRELDRKGEGWNLVLGLDQFEEVLDRRSEPADNQEADALERFFQFLRAALGSGRIGIFYTSQMDRLPILHRDPILGPVAIAGEAKQVFLPDNTLEEIIKGPFEAAGFALQPSLVRRFRELVLAFAGQADASAQGSLLPLLSLRLARLAESHQDKRTRGKSDAAAQDRVLTLDQYENELDIAGAIAELATEALQEARNAPGVTWYEETVGQLLRRLVRLHGSDRHRLNLPEARLPSSRAARGLAQSLMRRRLLLPVGEGNVRIAHEALLRQWPVAAKWLEEERHLLGLAGILWIRAQEWEEQGRPAEALREIGPQYVAEAAEILASWFDVLGPEDGSPIRAEDQLLKDYAFACLAARPTPAQEALGRVVEGVRRVHNHFLLAAYYGEDALLERYLADDPSAIRLARNDGANAVFSAAWRGSLTTLNLLLAAGADPGVPSGSGWLPIHNAATAGHASFVARLIEADPSSSRVAGGAQGSQPLHIACWHNRASIVDLLLENKEVSANQRNKNGWTPFHLACRYAEGRIVRALLARPEVDPASPLDPGKPNFTPLLLAIAGGVREVVEILLADPRVDPTAPGPPECLPFREAIARDRGQIVELLLADGRVDPTAKDAQGETALHDAARSRQTRTANRLLRDSRTDPFAANVHRQTPMGILTGAGRTELLRPLLNDPEVMQTLAARRHQRWLLLAAHAEDRAAVRRLLDHPEVDPACADSAGNTLLHVVLAHRDLEFAKELIANPRISRWAVTHDGATPLHAALNVEAEEIVDLLLRDDTVDDATLRSFSTVLNVVAKRRNLLPVLDRLLRDGRFDPNARGKHGMTPLHVATLAGNLAGIELLLADSRVDREVEDDWGRTLLDLSPLSIRRELAALLSLEKRAREDGRERSSDADEHWAPVDWETIRWLVAKVDPIDEVRTLSAGKTIAERRALPFYDQLELIRFKDPSWDRENLALHYLVVTGEAPMEFRLDGTSPPIHQVNAKLKVAITEENVVDYLRFFCFFVHGEEGPFYIVHSEHDPFVPDLLWGKIEDPNVQSAARLENCFRPPAFHGRDAEGRFRCSAIVFYSNAIFYADFLIHSTGFIEMPSDEPLITDLPVKVEAPLK